MAHLEQFVKDYIEAWSTTSPDDRRQLIEKVYSASADFYADEPGDDAVHHHGLKGIFGNISQVNERLVVGGGLVTECTGFSENHDALRVTWQMKAPDGDVVLKGMNFLRIDSSGKITRDYIFIN
ncbi:MAG: hypothetical protein LBP52_02585 [Burkholderiaceae bacterium]|jgi:hypothetical protein|nr:hypothetical protein [Burkholderiaceae bacterium]